MRTCETLLNHQPGETGGELEAPHFLVSTPKELATCYLEKLNVKVLLLNNQHLGMVMQWEDRFYKVRECGGVWKQWVWM